MSRLTRRFDEEWQFEQMVRSLQLQPEHAVLDVGCGYGRNLRLLRGAGVDAVGIDINTAAVAANRADGFSCLSLEEFQKTDTVYDLIIMSHIIEHFAPAALLAFMDEYLARLAVGGHLLIATPLLSTRFYDDFDHVRPYPPYAIDMMFTRQEGQTQYASRYWLEPVQVRVRRRYRRLSPQRMLFLRQHCPLAAKATIKLLPVLFEWTAGLIGCTDGWLGLYRNRGLRTSG